MTAWYDRDDWWEGTTEVLFGTSAWESAPEQVAQVLALAAVKPPLDVLDLPCGVGRHAMELARLGCRVTAVDRTAAYLDQVRVHAHERGLDIETGEADMREFCRAGSFDLVVNLFTSFGYFEDQADDVRVLENFHASLRPGGVLVMDVMGKEVLARIFTPRAWRELDDGTLLLEDRSVTRDWTWITNRWIVIKGAERREYPFANRVYGASDLRQVLEQAGFDPIQIYGSLAGTPYDHAASRLVAVAHRPPAPVTGGVDE